MRGEEPLVWLFAEVLPAAHLLDLGLLSARPDEFHPVIADPVERHGKGEAVVVRTAALLSKVASEKRSAERMIDHGAREVLRGFDARVLVGRREGERRKPKARRARSFERRTEAREHGPSQLPVERARVGRRILAAGAGYTQKRAIK